MIKTGGKDPTVVTVGQWKGGKISGKRVGDLDDITEDATVLAEVKVQGGVYFMNGGKTFGVSLAASLLLVVKPEGGTASGKRKLDMGDVEFTDGEGDEEGE